MNYQEIKNQQPILRNCFFAFSKEQFNEGIAKHNLEGQKIYEAQGGLYGTQEAIDELMNFYNGITEQIVNECTPQEVYDYEHGNHECEYIGDDTAAFEIVLHYWSDRFLGLQKCLDVKRKNAVQCAAHILDM